MRFETHHPCWYHSLIAEGSGSLGSEKLKEILQRKGRHAAAQVQHGGCVSSAEDGWASANGGHGGEAGG